MAGLARNVWVDCLTGDGDMRLSRSVCGAGLLLVLALGASSPAMAQETTTYSYDALGRVVGVARSGGPANGTNTAYAYDPASNRTNVTVTNSPNGAGNGSSGSGATAATTRYVVLPISGYTIIQFQQ